MDYYQQQGDVLLKKSDMVFDRNKARRLKTNILREGEFTGHAHRIVSGNYELYEYKKKMILVALTLLKLQHEEHQIQEIPAGEYVITSVREYDHLLEESRAIAD